jgi:hypothetical protein
VPKAKRHSHLPGIKGYFNVTALQAGAGPLWVCKGGFDALALLAAGVTSVVAIFGVQGWRWDWVRGVRELVFALDADAAGQQQSNGRKSIGTDIAQPHPAPRGTVGLRA